MDLERNEFRTVLALIIHIACWVLLVQLRRKHFSIPRVQGYLVLNLFFLSYFYLSTIIVLYQGTSTLLILTHLTITDLVFGVIYTSLSDYLHVSGYLGFSLVPKFFMALCLYFYYDDRLDLIIQYSFYTLVINAVTALATEELLVDCYNEEITEFAVIDYFVLMYMDIPYILSKARLNFKD
jgi:hypothetical protein